MKTALSQRLEIEPSPLQDGVHLRFPGLLKVYNLKLSSNLLFSFLNKSPFMANIWWVSMKNEQSSYNGVSF